MAEDEATADTGAEEDGKAKREHHVVSHAPPTQFSAGKPSRHTKEKLMLGEGIIPVQSGSNKFASQKGLTGFGRPRDVLDHSTSTNLRVLTDEQVGKTKELIPLQSGTNKFASQKGMTGFRTPRDVLYKPKGTGGAQPVSEDKAKITEGIIPLQSGTNKLASQAGCTGFGMPRTQLAKNNPDQVRDSQGFIHLQMGTNRFASQAGQTGFGMPRHNISKFTDTQRGIIPHDESSLSRQTSGYKEGANQNGMSGFGSFRNTTILTLNNQDRKSQGMIPYQMGINWADSQAGKTGFGMPRQVLTNWVDDARGEFEPELARAPDVPKWTGVIGGASQTGMTAMGMPRDVKGHYLRRLW